MAPDDILPLISLIVPVYNTARFIEECLDSVIDQLPNDCEVIFVDDGSTDDSAGIIDRYIGNSPKPNVRLIRQTNQGPGGARNRGIDDSRGAYVAFLDADDTLDDGFFDRMRKEVSRLSKPPDVVTFNAAFLVEQVDGSWARQGDAIPLVKRDRVIDRDTGDPDDEAFNRHMGQGVWFTWLRLYRRTLFSEVRFPTESTYEDIATVPALLLKARRLHMIAETWVAYRQHLTGIMRSPRPRDLDDLNRIHTIYKDRYLKTFADRNPSRRAYFLVLCSIWSTVFDLTEQVHSRAQALKSRRSLQRDVGRRRLAHEIWINRSLIVDYNLARIMPPQLLSAGRRLRVLD